LNTEYPDQLGTPGKFVDNSTKITCLEITGYRIKYGTAFILNTEYPDQLGTPGKFVDNSTKSPALKLPVIGSSTVQSLSGTPIIRTTLVLRVNL
jgi:hypothetical protein